MSNNGYPQIKVGDTIKCHDAEDLKRYKKALKDAGIRTRAASYSEYILEVIEVKGVKVDAKV